MFPIISNVSGLEAVSEVFEIRKTDFPPSECILEPLVFNEKFYLQEDGNAMGSRISCSYSDIAMYRFDLKVFS